MTDFAFCLSETSVQSETTTGNFSIQPVGCLNILQISSDEFVPFSVDWITRVLFALLSVISDMIENQGKGREEQQWKLREFQSVIKTEKITLTKETAIEKKASKFKQRT